MIVNHSPRHSGRMSDSPDDVGSVARPDASRADCNVMPGAPHHCCVCRDATPSDALYAPLLDEVVEHLRRFREPDLGNGSPDVPTESHRRAKRRIGREVAVAPASRATIVGQMPKDRDRRSAPPLSTGPGAKYLRGQITGRLLTPSQFAAKWSESTRSERAGAQEHFIDLCRMLGFETPNEADPKGDRYAFEKGAEKTLGSSGFADVWKRGHFGWEYKKKHKDLTAAYSQLLQYREALENPPLLVVCDLNRFHVHTNFTNTVKKTYKITLADLASAPEEPLRILRAVMGDPEALRPDVTLPELTERAASRFAELAKTLRAKHLDPQRVAHFLNKLVFCMFAQRTGLLPPRLIQRLAENTKRDPVQFGKGLRDLFSKMSKSGGLFGPEEIQWFNGGLFDGEDVLPLTSKQIEVVRDIAELDWSEVEPAIFGTLFERGLDPDKRSQLGAHYTDRESIEKLVEPVLLEPLRRELETMKSDVERILAQPAKGSSAQTKRQKRAEDKFISFLDRLTKLSILDPACGSGNFLYVALQAVKSLERDAILWGSAALKKSQMFPAVGPEIVHGIELNSYAAELARVTIWIGEIQWMINNGFSYSRNPVLRPLESIRCEDALMNGAERDDPVETAWPPAEFIVGNPTFLGGKLLRENLGDDYVNKLFKVYEGRVAKESDYVCYWFEKARQNIEAGETRRAGLIATQAIRGGANRRAIDRIKKTGDIFLAWSDCPWIVNGAEVHVSIVGFDDGSEKIRIRDGVSVAAINADLTAGIDLTKAPRLAENVGIAFMGDSKGGKFDIPPDLAKEMLAKSNPHERPNADVVIPWLNGASVTKRPREYWIIDFGTQMKEREAALYEAPFEYVKREIKRGREKSRTTIDEWWRHERPRPEMRAALTGLKRFIGTVRHAKHRIFFWIPAGTLPDSALIVFARDDDYTFGVLQSRVHTVWSLAKGTQVREKETGFRYTPTTTFDTFPFPAAQPKQREAIAVAARALETFRQGWLKPKIGSQRSLTQLYTENPTWLRQAHERLDAAVTAAYGWPGALSDDEILLQVLKLNAQWEPVAASRGRDEGCGSREPEKSDE